jgi:sec-independent protein translocase protein TatA
MLAEIIGPDILIILAIVALLFGGSQLPKLARGLGEAQREFHKGMRGDEEEKKAEPKPEPPKSSETAEHTSDS